MIRINLLEAESRPEAPPRIGRGMRAALAAGLAAAAAGLVLWPVLSVRAESARLEQRSRAVEREMAGLAGASSQRDEAEQRVADLARRVALVEALEAARGVPARMLEQLGRVLSDGVRLTELRQQGRDVVIEGRAAGMAGVSDLVAGLESSGYFLPPVEIVESRLEAQAGAEAVHFQLRMSFSPPSS